MYTDRSSGGDAGLLYAANGIPALGQRPPGSVARGVGRPPSAPVRDATRAAPQLPEARVTV
jgi:hypothetical protein